MTDFSFLLKWCRRRWLKLQTFHFISWSLELSESRSTKFSHFIPHSTLQSSDSLDSHQSPVEAIEAYELDHLNVTNERQPSSSLSRSKEHEKISSKSHEGDTWGYLKSDLRFHIKKLLIRKATMTMLKARKFIFWSIKFLFIRKNLIFTGTESSQHQGTVKQQGTTFNVAISKWIIFRHQVAPFRSSHRPQDELLASSDEFECWKLTKVHSWYSLDSFWFLNQQELYYKLFCQMMQRSQSSNFKFKQHRFSLILTKIDTLNWMKIEVNWD